MKKNLLIVVDLQNDFVDGSLGTKEARAIVPNVVRKIKSFDGDVFYTLDTHYEDYLSTLEGKNLPVEHCIIDTEGHKVVPEVMEALKAHNATEFTKPTFGCKHLVQHLSNAYDSIELIGLCTDICVISNALLIKAFFPFTPISVDASCCAGVTPETHEAALTTMKMCQIAVTGE